MADQAKKPRRKTCKRCKTLQARDTLTDGLCADEIACTVRRDAPPPEKKRKKRVIKRRSRVAKRWLDKCPAPGQPAGIWTDYDRLMWTGCKKQWELKTTLVTMTYPSGATSKFHVVGRDDTGEILASAKGTQGLGPHECAMIRAWQGGESEHDYKLRLLRWREREPLESDEKYTARMVAKGEPKPRRKPMNARQIVEMFALGNDGIVPGMKYERGTYYGETKIPAIYRVAWESGIMLAQLVCDTDSDGGYAKFEQKGSGGTDSLDRIDIRLLLGNIPDGDGRLKWLLDLDIADRRRLADAIALETKRMVQDPPPWPWWAGSQKMTAHFVRRSTFNNRREPVGVKSWAFKKCGLRTLCKRLVGPDTAIAESLDLGYSSEQQLDMYNRGEF